jgi:predicted  nucleic acid-binding Zn-ribbon protein
MATGNPTVRETFWNRLRRRLRAVFWPRDRDATALEIEQRQRIVTLEEELATANNTVFQLKTEIDRLNARLDVSRAELRGLAKVNERNMMRLDAEIAIEARKIAAARNGTGSLHRAGATREGVGVW